MGIVSRFKVITTGASLSGWGAILDGRTPKGTWNEAYGTKLTNYLKLLAVLLALKRFEPLLVGCYMLVCRDNTTTMSYINRQGGMASPSLDVMAGELILWCNSRLKSIRAVHLPGLQNHGADLLSRGRYYYEDWSLRPSVARQIFVRYGCPSVDLFASEANAKCSRYFSVQGQSTMGLEALAHEWPRVLLYAFLPLRLIYPLLDRVRRQGLSVLLIAPGWGSWRSEIAPLLHENPWRLPPLTNLVSQAAGTILHPRPVEQVLWVWPVRGNPSPPAV